MNSGQSLVSMVSTSITDPQITPRISRVLVSACLLGERVRYDGTSRPIAHSLLDQLQRSGRLLALCPETLGGLLVPRPAAEIQPGFDGADIWQEAGRVITRQGHNVSQYFVRGARKARELALQQGVVMAVLKANSPSCGNETIYSGAFDKSLRSGQGVTAAALRDAGISVFNEHQLADAQVFLAQHDSLRLEAQP